MQFVSFEWCKNRLIGDVEADKSMKSMSACSQQASSSARLLRKEQKERKKKKGPKNPFQPNVSSSFDASQHILFINKDLMVNSVKGWTNIQQNQ